MIVIKGCGIIHMAYRRHALAIVTILAATTQPAYSLALSLPVGPVGTIVPAP